MARIYIAFPARSYGASLSDAHRLHDWLIANRVKGCPGIEGMIVFPRYKGNKLSIANISDKLKDQPFWRSGARLDILGDDSMNFFRDLELPRDASFIDAKRS